MTLIPDFRGLSLRYKLLALVLGPSLLLAGTVIYLSAYWSTSYTYEQLFTKVNTDLRVAHNVFERFQIDRQRSLTALANSFSFLGALEHQDYNDVLQQLNRHKVAAGFDFINLLSQNGEQRLFDDGWHQWRLKQSPLTEQVLEDAKPSKVAPVATGIEIYSRQDWQHEPSVLPEKVVFPLVDTPRAAPTDKVQEDRAMVIRALQRIIASDGKTLGFLEGGLLLNRNYGFVDEIRDLVYGPGSLAEGSRGTVTVFLDDVRITTNVPSSDDSRALGTRVSVEVRNTVLEQGTPWIDRAFVVNDWYISAYEPIEDVYGNRVGMLYAGYLEAPFRNELFRAIAVVSAVVLVGSVIALIAATLGAKSIFKPVEAIASVVRATANGERRRIGELNARDEIGELATQFDSMLDSLESQREHIEAGAHQLEHKVAERTTELKSKNKSLEQTIKILHQTQQRLATAEKLAAIGQLTAGVAHEVNNPTAVILGNMDVLIEELGEHRAEVQTEIDLIIEQVDRIRSITDRLLQYSRTSTAGSASGQLQTLLDAEHFFRTDDSEAVMPSQLSLVNVNELIDSSLVLVRHELEQKKILLNYQAVDVPDVLIDGQELQQVIVNIVINAIQAVVEKGEIQISTGTIGDQYVVISVADNGVGINKANQQKLFDPFFTFGKEGGTGLGLSVSYGIVSRYNGYIEVDSSLGDGARFQIVLPAEKQQQIQLRRAVVSL